MGTDNDDDTGYVRKYPSTLLFNSLFLFVHYPKCSVCVAHITRMFGVYICIKYKIKSYIRKEENRIAYMFMYYLCCCCCFLNHSKLNE